MPVHALRNAIAIRIAPLELLYLPSATPKYTSVYAATSCAVSESSREFPIRS